MKQVVFLLMGLAQAIRVLAAGQQYFAIKIMK